MARAYFRLFHLFFAVVFLIALIFDIKNNLNALGNYFSYFSIQNVLLTTIVFLLLALQNKFFKNEFFAVSRLAVVFYAFAASIIFYIFLKPTGTYVTWIEVMFHIVLPLTAFTSIILFPTKRKLGLSALPWVFVYPATYLAFIFTKGEISGLYPYGFLNPMQEGIQNVLIFILLSLVLGSIFVIMLVHLSNFLNGRNLPN